MLKTFILFMLLNPHSNLASNIQTQTFATLAQCNAVKERLLSRRPWSGTVSNAFCIADRED